MSAPPRSTAPALIAPVAITEAGVDDYSQDSLDLIRTTYARDLTDQEFQLLIAHGKRLGLSLLAKEVVGLKFKGVMTPMLTLAGARKLAMRSQLYDGSDGPYWCGPDGVFREFWDSDEPPVAAKFAVYVKGRSRPSWGVATWRERHQEYYDKDARVKKLMGLWASMPALMLGKVSETDALKRAGLIADVEVAVDEEEAAAAPKKQAALKHAHQIAPHAQIKAALGALVPGAESLMDEEVTAADIAAAAGMAAAFGDEAGEIIEGEVVPGEAGAGVSAREAWRIALREAFEHWDEQTARATRAKMEGPAEAWKWLDAIELAPTVKLRDVFAERARALGVSQGAVDAAAARRGESAQVRRAAERAREEPA